MGTLPLAGITVVDLTRALAGPVATALLSDLGARVIKIETHPYGDGARAWGPFDEQDESLYFAAANRNKESVVLDLRSEHGKHALRRLVERSDVLIENFRPGVLARMGFDSEELRAQYPGLVITSLTGFGPRGPERDTPGLDQIAQGMSGLMSVTGPGPDQPTRVGVPIVDTATGVFGALATVAALAGRERTGQGAHVQTSLLESALSLMTFQAQRYLSIGEVPEPQGNEHPVISPYGAFRTADLPINIATGSDRQWRALCDVLGAPELAERPEYRTGRQRSAASAQLRTEIEGLLAARPAADWIPLIRKAEIPAGPVYRMDDVFADPQVAALGIVQQVATPSGRVIPLLRGPIWIDGAPPQVRSAPPAVGQHTRSVLTEFGISQSDTGAGSDTARP